MVKGRRIQGGSSNLSTIESDKTSPTVFFRAPTHKLIAPDVYKVTAPKTKAREIESMSTWGNSTVHNIDYVTVHKSTYKNPATYPTREKESYQTPEEIEEAHQKSVAFNSAMKKLCTLSRKTYGTTSAMLKSVCVMITFI
jgi:hypothetical protein